MEALEREQHLRQLAEQRTAGLASKFWGPLRRRLGDFAAVDASFGVPVREDPRRLITDRKPVPRVTYAAGRTRKSPPKCHTR
jgi:hypothetical protein